MVFRMQSGRFRGSGGWVTMNPTGTPDLLAIDKATQRAVFIETKKVGGSTSKEQIAFRDAYTALGGQSIIADSLGSFIQQITLV